jgi:hypothetical protein
LKPLLQLQPISFREACAFIKTHHRHHTPPQGFLFGLAVNDGSRVVGVATVGRPVARRLQDGWTAEVTRLCTDGTPHAASKLLSAARRAAHALGYKRVITYILVTETGVSLKAAGWVEKGKAGGGDWNKPSRPRVCTAPQGQKMLWEAQP